MMAPTTSRSICRFSNLQGLHLMVILALVLGTSFVNLDYVQAENTTKSPSDEGISSRKLLSSLDQNDVRRLHACIALSVIALVITAVAIFLAIHNTVTSPCMSQKACAIAKAFLGVSVPIALGIFSLSVGISMLTGQWIDKGFVVLAYAAIGYAVVVLVVSLVLKRLQLLAQRAVEPVVLPNGPALPLVPVVLPNGPGPAPPLVPIVPPIIPPNIPPAPVPVPAPAPGINP